MKHSRFAEELYQKLTNEEDARVCKAIEERACREVPGNFLLMILSHFLTKCGDTLTNPKIVMPWVFQAVAAPVAFIGFLVPIRESGSLLPQLMIAAFVRGRALRKWIWVLGSVLQAGAVLAMAGTVLTLSGALAGWTLLVLLVVFSLARGLCSVASKDVLGKTIPKTRRGQINGWSASAAGLVTVVFAVWLFLQRDRIEFGPSDCALLLAVAGAFWLLAAVVYAMIREFPGATSGGANALATAFGSLGLLVKDKPFRRFVITRAMLLCSALTAPYIVALAQQEVGTEAYMLGLFLLASGAASLISAPAWGRFADRSSRLVIMFGAAMTASVAASVALAFWMMPAVLALPWMLPLAYFFLALAHQGVRVGRKTYVVDLAEGDQRTDYVAVSNSVIGVVLLLLGGSGWIASVFDIATAIAFLSTLGAMGAWLARSLPEVQSRP
ncbi:MFS transporter [Gilvimarinus algae]|uniref:MFS transporter n=1 Tax=Gilvimarinus algae TaxID=3058037 RepID=A0ABT8TIL8_9GAMM|nr:MFS transporter [Gilvimarinus sp. SDUM040014]MDO3383941.1 MFS transporter [Gilvimarinus sp. SDUM040014]